MQTKQAIQTSANVIRITSISAGDVYKRFDESYDDRVYLGVVQAVHNDGEKTIIEAIEYNARYSSLDVDYKVMRGEKEYILFPATPEELSLELAKAKRMKEREIEEAEDKIAKNRKLLGEIEGMISGEKLKELKSASYKEISQVEYSRKVAELNA